VAASKPELLPSGALRELDEIKARAYREQVWLRLRRDRVAAVDSNARLL